MRQPLTEGSSGKSRYITTLGREASGFVAAGGRQLFKNGLCSLWANRPKRTLGAWKRRSLKFEAGARQQSTSQLYRLPRAFSMHRAGLPLFVP